jgi:hypothetical protein
MSIPRHLGGNLGEKPWFACVRSEQLIGYEANPVFTVAAWSSPAIGLSQEEPSLLSGSTRMERKSRHGREVPPIPVLPELEPKSEDNAAGTKPVDQGDNEVVFSFALGGLKSEVSVAKP